VGHLELPVLCSRHGDVDAEQPAEKIKKNPQKRGEFPSSEEIVQKGLENVGN